MSVETIVRELEQLPLSDKLLVLEKTIKSIRLDREKKLKSAADALYEDYQTDTELTAFTVLDKEPFYETR